MENESSEKAVYNVLSLDGFDLWKGCILALCVHGVMLPEYPFILNEHIWQDGIYLTQDNAGRKAALAFTDEGRPLVGVFRQSDSSRVALVLSDMYASSFFKGAPEEERELAGAMFQLFREEVGTQTLPVVTTGFWSRGEEIFSRDSFEDWYVHGGGILDQQMLPFEAALAYYEDYYDMDAKRLEITRRVYQARVRSPYEEVYLTPEEVDAIMVNGPYNRDASEDAFRRFQVYFES